MPRAAKPRKAYRRRLVNIPVMPELLLQFEQQLRISLACLQSSSGLESFDAIAEILDIVGLTLEEMKRPSLLSSFRIIQSGASAMLQIKGKFERTDVIHMTDLEYLPIRNAVNEALEVLPKLSVTNLYMAMQEIKGIRKTS